MPAPRKEKLLDHEYDGIREYDNPTPGWWHAIFFVTVVFSVFYYAFWEHSPIAYSIQDSWRAAQTREFTRIFGELGELAPDEPTILAMMANPQMLQVAEGIFVGNCAACHAKDGGAGGGAFTGVNLTDDHFKNVKVLPDILRVINKGANNGAMPAWETRLSQNERIILAAYVASLRGTIPASAKGADGEPIPPWPETPAPAPPAGG